MICRLAEKIYGVCKMTSPVDESKPSLDELVIAIDDVNYVYEQYKYADWSYLRDNKSHLLKM